MWEDRYKNSPDYLFGKEPAHILRENPWARAGATNALCVGDGEGRNAVFLAECGFEVSSFDLSPTAAQRARALAVAEEVSVDAYVSEWNDWDFSREFDLVVAIFVQFTGPDERPKQFEDLQKATKPGGRLILHGFTPDQVGRGTGGPPVAENMYTEEMLKDAFKGWDILRLASYEREQNSGTAHVGKAALIDLIAQRPG